MIWRREEYIAHMNFQYTGREFFCELFGPLHALEPEWRAQGASDDEVSLKPFGFNYVLKTALPVKTDMISELKPYVVEDAPEYRISVDEYGRKNKLIKNSATISLPMDYPVKTMEDWLKIKHRYLFTEDRVNIEGLKKCAEMRKEGYLTVAYIPGGFDLPRQLMGEEEICCAFYEQPELIIDILNTVADTAVKVFERTVEICGIDNLSIHEDLAGKSGPLIGPNTVIDYLKPYYRKIWDMVHDSGCTIFSQDSDGNINAVLDAFLECGVNCFYPFEPMAGMDMVESRKKYGKAFSVKGGIDKFALRGTKEDIERELRYKMEPLKGIGGVAFGLDHRIPNGVSLENYKYYVKLAREILGIAQNGEYGWERMAF